MFDNKNYKGKTEKKPINIIELSCHSEFLYRNMFLDDYYYILHRKFNSFVSGSHKLLSEITFSRETTREIEKILK